MSRAQPSAPSAQQVQAAIAAAIAVPAIKLKLQINTTGAWRNVIDFERDDDLACAAVLTAAPLLAAAAELGAKLRICSADGLQKAHSHWQAGQGWRGALPPGAAGSRKRLAVR